MVKCCHRFGTCYDRRTIRLTGFMHLTAFTIRLD